MLGAARKPIPYSEGLPLYILLAGKGIAETGGHLFRPRCPAPFECLLYRVRKDGAFEPKRLRDHPEVIEILHATVGDTERDDRLSLFSNDGFWWIGA